MTVFVDRVAGDDNTVATAVVRRAATTAAERLISDPGTPTCSEAAVGRHGLAMYLFCLVYTSFIAGMVAEFAKAVIAEQITLAVTGLLLIDPAGRIPELVGEQVAALIPNPCEQAEMKHDTRRRRAQRSSGDGGVGESACADRPTAGGERASDALSRTDAEAGGATRSGTSRLRRAAAPVRSTGSSLPRCRMRF
jgi:hypothetical protein